MWRWPVTSLVVSAAPVIPADFEAANGAISTVDTGLMPAEGDMGVTGF